MYYNIPEEKKEKIIYSFIYTRKRIPKIAEDLGLSFEEVMWVLEQYNNKRKEEGKGNITRGNNDDEKLDNMIYTLRNKGMSYEKISDEVGLCTQYVSKRCKIIYAKKDEIEPTAIKNSSSGMINLNIDDEIVRLRQEGKSFRQIGKMLPDKKKRSRQAVHARYNKTIKKDNQKLAKEIMKLTTTKNATVEQIEKIAEYYGVDLEESFRTIE